MKTLYLKAIEDPIYGEVGLVVEGTQIGINSTVNTATSGELIAHDILEHQNGVEAIGSLDDELEAFGALWFNRGSTGQLRENMSFIPCDEALAIEVSEMGMKYLYRGFETPIPKTLSYTDHEADLEWISNRAFEFAVQDLREEDSGRSRKEIAHDLWALREYHRASLLYMCRGAYKAEKRFGTQHRCYSTFWAMAKAIDPYTVDCIEGQRFKLQYNFDGVIRFEEVEYM